MSVWLIDAWTEQDVPAITISTHPFQVPLRANHQGYHGLGGLRYDVCMMPSNMRINAIRSVPSAAG
ncbi:hypothetical protein PM082_010319 [Marasmius tenuissimus]|nr:hypothetical protein PM082_010319 [Marasmius tenuissimus]